MSASSLRIDRGSSGVAFREETTRGTANGNDVVQLHRDATVCLSYVNPWIEYSSKELSARRYFTEAAPWLEATIPMMRKGGVDLVVLSHGNPDASRLPGAMGVECLFRCFDAMIGEIDRQRDLMLIQSRRDMDAALQSGKMGIILGITGAPFNGDLANLRTFFRMGVRTVHPFMDDLTVGGYAGAPKNAGLKPFGRKIIREMERLGMLVDVTHANDRTFTDVLRFAEKPIIDSHTNSRALANYDRCCTDSQLRAIGKAGGLVGAHFGFLEEMNPAMGDFYKKIMGFFNKKLNGMKRKYKDNPYEFLRYRNDPFEWPLCLGGAVDDGTPIYRAKMSLLGDHIAHMVKMAGIDHVCIGSDYSGGAMPEELETVETLVNLTAELVRRGFSASEVKKIWGGNFVRILRKVLP